MIERLGNEIEEEKKKIQTAFTHVWGEEEGDSE